MIEAGDLHKTAANGILLSLNPKTAKSPAASDVCYQKVRSELDVNRIEAIEVQIYSQLLTEEQALTITRFFQSPLGDKYKQYSARGLRAYAGATDLGPEIKFSEEEQKSLLAFLGTPEGEVITQRDGRFGQLMSQSMGPYIKQLVDSCPDRPKKS